MTDQKTTFEMNDDDARTLADIEQFSEESDNTEAKLRQLDVKPGGSATSYSLKRLEEDLRTLHSKWQAVEQEIAERDEQIALLQREMDRSEEMRGAIEADLEAAAADKQQLADELQAQQRQFEDEIAQHSKTSSDVQDRISALESENTGLRVHLQELQAYIDGRKDDWSDLKAQIKEYENTINGMSDTLESHEDVVARKEEEKAALALKVMELEREFSELKGRHTEKESSHEELQQTLDDQARELGSLNSETIKLHKDIERLQKKLERRDETVKSLRKDLKEHDRDSSSLEDLLSSEKATIKDQQNRLAQLEESLRAREATEEVLRTEVAQYEKKLEEISFDAKEHEIRAAELQAVLLESESEQKSLRQELDAQRELVQVLERDLAKKQQDLDLLDRSADRISAIHSGIRELDFQIDDHWIQQPEKVVDQVEEIFGHGDEVMIDPEALLEAEDENAEHLIVAMAQGGAESVRYPLLDREVTIGRSRRSDIRLNSKYISRIHARIKVDGDCAIIEDAGSTNGFLVNSVETRHHSLAHGDLLEIGDCKLRYLHPSAAH